MTFNYDKLWKLLDERKMMKTELVRISGISTNAMARMGKGEDVRLSVMAKISYALGCKIDDLFECEYSNDRKDEKS